MKEFTKVKSINKDLQKAKESLFKLNREGAILVLSSTIKSMGSVKQSILIYKQRTWVKCKMAVGITKNQHTSKMAPFAMLSGLTDREIGTKANILVGNMNFGSAMVSHPVTQIDGKTQNLFEI